MRALRLTSRNLPNVMRVVGLLAGLLAVSAALFVAAGCASTSYSQRWSGELARTYEADVAPVVNATAKAFQNVGMGVESRQAEQGVYVVSAVKESSTSYGPQGVQLTGMSVYVRDLGGLGANVQIRIPEREANYASRRDDNYAI